MAIQVVKEPDAFAQSTPENCFKCNCPTHYWYEPKDVPCCPDCAKKLEDKDVPSKKEWLGV